MLMSRRTGKSILTRALQPFARLTDASARLRRVWAHARTAVRLEDGLDPAVVVLGAPEVHGSGRIRVGRDALLYPDLYFETEGHGVIEIGERAVLSRGVHLVAYDRITIGACTMIGEYASVRDANHRIDPDVSVRDSGHDAWPIVIGAHVWIGRGAAILPGVRIGDRAVVGANAVVTHDVEPGAVVAGVPARPLRARRGGGPSPRAFRRAGAHGA